MREPPARCGRVESTADVTSDLHLHLHGVGYQDANIGQHMPAQKVLK